MDRLSIHMQKYYLALLNMHGKIGQLFATQIHL